MARSKTLFARAGALGSLDLDDAGYPLLPPPDAGSDATTSNGAGPQGCLLVLGQALHFAAAGGGGGGGGGLPTPPSPLVSVTLLPRFSTYLLLEQMTGMLRYVVAEATTRSGGGGGPPREQKSLVLSSVHAWVVRGGACLDVQALQCALLSHGGDREPASDCMDASNRLVSVRVCVRVPVCVC